MTCLAGRLLVDTYVCSRDLLKEVEYSLASLSAKLLQQNRQELNANEVRRTCAMPCSTRCSAATMLTSLPLSASASQRMRARAQQQAQEHGCPHSNTLWRTRMPPAKRLCVVQVGRMCKAADSLMKLVGHAESDAWLALGLCFYLSAVPLTLQLSNLSGFLWPRTLQGNRAQRIEMLLLHEFHCRKFMLPDKPDKRGGGAQSGRGGRQSERQGGGGREGREGRGCGGDTGGDARGGRRGGRWR